MKILGLNINVSRSPKPVQEIVEAVEHRSAGISVQQWLKGEDLANPPSMANAYQQVVWVYRAINVLAEQVANVPFLFSSGSRGSENLITSGPLVDFYKRPHPQMDRFQYWELRVIWLMLRGECVRIPIYSDDEKSALRAPHSALKEVLVLDPARFQHIVEDNRLMGWRYTGFGPEAPLASQVFLPEEVWFEKLPNPYDFWRGFPPLYVAGMAANTDFAAGAFMRGIIENNADTGVIVRTDQWVSDDQRDQILTALRERKRRAGVADRPVLLPGSVEVIRPQLSGTDLQFLENRKFSRSEICAAFGVPEEIVTSTDHAKYDVMAGARLNFIENRVAPLCSRLEAAEQVTVRAIDPAASGWFDLDSLPIMQDARRNRLAAAKTGFDMGIPFNELNRVLDLGFQPLPWGDTGYVPSTMLPAVPLSSSAPVAPKPGE
ncbi:MAG TPA: phage portal protein [Verrucomicrobiae bacterium]|nr:phage portal protein [Verrucomicrobiae bacterium]